MNHAKTSILILEDDEDVCELVHTTLDNASRRVFAARNADDVLQLISKTPPDILILDIGLHGSVDGLTILEALVADRRFKRLQVVIVSGSDSWEHISRAEHLGVTAFLQKPFSPSRLSAIVAQMELKSQKMHVIPAENKNGGAITLSDLFGL